MNIAKILKTPILKNIYGRLVLYIRKNILHVTQLSLGCDGRRNSWAIVARESYFYGSLIENVAKKVKR